MRERNQIAATVEGVQAIESEARDAVELIASGDVQMVINTPSGSGARADGGHIRSACITHKVACLTTLAAGVAAALGIGDTREHGWRVRSLQELHA